MTVPAEWLYSLQRYYTSPGSESPYRRCFAKPLTDPSTALRISIHSTETELESRRVADVFVGAQSESGVAFN